MQVARYIGRLQFLMQFPGACRRSAAFFAQVPPNFCVLQGRVLYVMNKLKVRTPLDRPDTSQDAGRAARSLSSLECPSSLGLHDGHHMIPDMPHDAGDTAQTLGLGLTPWPADYHPGHRHADLDGCVSCITRAGFITLAATALVDPRLSMLLLQIYFDRLRVQESVYSCVRIRLFSTSAQLAKIT